MDFDTTVKLQVYAMIVATARMPNAAETSDALSASEADVLAALHRLAGQRLLVLKPDDPGAIRMAPPFSGVPTTFTAHVNGKEYDANCVWDGLGVCAALGADGEVRTSDGHTGEPMILQVRDGNVVPTPCVVHFAVPAARWWEDIVYT